MKRCTNETVARKDPFLIRSYRNGDEEKILRLFRTCFESARRLDHWRWKYAENPYGQHQISLAFSPLGELAAHYAGYPVPYWLDDESGQRECLALHMGDTMTDPSFRQIGSRRSGLLARTVQHFFAIRKGGNFGFFFGFNTGPIQRFSEWFIGGERLDPLRCWTRDLDTILPWKEDGRYRIERIHRVGSAWDRFFRRVAPHYRFLIRRDARYLRWRYLGCPDTEYVVLGAKRWGRPVGWSVFRRLDDRLVWVDALVDPRHSGASRSLLAATRRYPQLAGVVRLESWFSERPAWWKQQLLELELWWKQPTPGTRKSSVAGRAVGRAGAPGPDTDGPAGRGRNYCGATPESLLHHGR